MSLLEAVGHESLNRSPKKNWVERAGQLPAAIQHMAKDIHEEKGVPLDEAIPIAISQAKKLAPDHPKYAKAVAEWEALKAKNAAKKLKEAAPAAPVKPKQATPKQGTTYNELVRLGDESPNVTHLQTRLNELGFGPGAQDGKFGPLTHRALTRFQRDFGLPMTGEVDQDTVGKLRTPGTPVSRISYAVTTTEPTVEPVQQQEEQPNDQAQVPEREGNAEGQTKPRDDGQARTAGEAKRPVKRDEGGKPERGATRKAGADSKDAPGKLHVVLDALGSLTESLPPDALPPLPTDQPGDGPTPREIPPNLRDGEGWRECGTCIYFNGKDGCIKWNYPVDEDDLCDSHYSLSEVFGLTLEDDPDVPDTDDPRIQESALRNLLEASKENVAIVSASGTLNELVRARVEEIGARRVYREFHLGEGAWDEHKHRRMHGKFSQKIGGLASGGHAYLGRGIHVRRNIASEGYQVELQHSLPGKSGEVVSAATADHAVALAEHARKHRTLAGSGAAVETPLHGTPAQNLARAKKNYDKAHPPRALLHGHHKEGSMNAPEALTEAATAADCSQCHDHAVGLVKKGVPREKALKIAAKYHGKHSKKVEEALGQYVTPFGAGIVDSADFNKKHPRGRAGQFIDVLSKLAHGESVHVGGVNVTKAGDNWQLRKPGLKGKAAHLSGSPEAASRAVNRLGQAWGGQPKRVNSPAMTRHAEDATPDSRLSLARQNLARYGKPDAHGRNPLDELDDTALRGLLNDKDLGHHAAQSLARKRGTNVVNRGAW